MEEGKSQQKKPGGALSMSPKFELTPRSLAGIAAVNSAKSGDAKLG